MKSSKIVSIDRKPSGTKAFELWMLGNPVCSTQAESVYHLFCHARRSLKLYRSADFAATLGTICGLCTPLCPNGLARQDPIICTADLYYPLQRTHSVSTAIQMIPRLESIG